MLVMQHRRFELSVVLAQNEANIPTDHVRLRFSKCSPLYNCSTVIVTTSKLKFIAPDDLAGLIGLYLTVRNNRSQPGRAMTGCHDAQMEGRVGMGLLVEFRARVCCGRDDTRIDQGALGAPAYGPSAPGRRSTARVDEG